MTNGYISTASFLVASEAQKEIRAKVTVGQITNFSVTLGILCGGLLGYFLRNFFKET